MSHSHEVGLLDEPYVRAVQASLIGLGLVVLAADGAIVAQDYLMPEHQLSITNSPTTPPEALPELPSPTTLPPMASAAAYEVTCDETAAETAPTPEISRSLAKDCLDVEEDTKVALVNYALDPSVAELLAQQIESDVTIVTAGQLHPDVTVVPASAQAKQALAAKTAAGDCIDPADPQEYSSTIADQTMPELSRFNRVIGLSGKSACGIKDLGVAEPTKYRDADLFDVSAADIQGIADNHGQLLPSSQTTYAAISAELYDAAQTAAHELLHLFGLGHSGNLVNSDKKDLQAWSLEDASAAKHTLNLDKFINNGSYTEYGNTDVMGSYTQTEASNLVLNPVEQSFLEWPQRLLDEPATVSQIDLNHTPAKFNSQNSASSMALLKLDHAYAMPKGGDSLNTDFGMSQTYGHLAFTATTSSGFVDGVNVYVIGDRHNAVFLGTLVQPEAGHSGYVIKSGHQTINIKFKADNSLDISATSTAP